MFNRLVPGPGQLPHRCIYEGVPSPLASRCNQNLQLRFSSHHVDWVRRMLPEKRKSKLSQKIAPKQFLALLHFSCLPVSHAARSFLFFAHGIGLWGSPAFGNGSLRVVSEPCAYSTDFRPDQLYGMDQQVSSTLP